MGTIRDIAVHDSVAHTTSVANHRTYDAFGNLVHETNAAVDLLFGFTGRLWDEATQIQNNTARWYDPVTGKWLSEDPKGFAAGDANLRRYVANSPTMLVDPTGLEGTGILTGSISDEQRRDKNQKREMQSRLLCETTGTNEAMRYSAQQHGEIVVEAERQGENIVIELASTAAGGRLLDLVIDGALDGWRWLRRARSAAKAIEKLPSPVAGLPRAGSALKLEPHHSFPDIVDSWAGDATKFLIPTKGPGGKVVRQSTLYQLKGCLNGKQGIFEWIVDNGQVTHRRFIPNGKLTGTPNQ